MPNTFLLRGRSELSSYLFDICPSSVLYVTENKGADQLRAALTQLVECRTLDRRVAGSNLTLGMMLCPKQDTSSSLLNIGLTQENVPK